jgi:hypothetical protein
MLLPTHPPTHFFILFFYFLQSHQASTKLTLQCTAACNVSHESCHGNWQFIFFAVFCFFVHVMITREIREASSPTMRGHFGCIFKATEEYTTGVWWAFYMRIMGT